MSLALRQATHPARPAPDVDLSERLVRLQRNVALLDQQLARRIYYEAQPVVSTDPLTGVIGYEFLYRSSKPLQVGLDDARLFRYLQSVKMGDAALMMNVSPASFAQIRQTLESAACHQPLTMEWWIPSVMRALDVIAAREATLQKTPLVVHALDEWVPTDANWALLRRLCEHVCMVKVSAACLVALDQQHLIERNLLALCNWGRAMGIAVVAKGVHSPELLERVWQLGFTAYQGELVMDQGFVVGMDD